MLLCFVFIYSTVAGCKYEINLIVIVMVLTMGTMSYRVRHYEVGICDCQYSSLCYAYREISRNKVKSLWVLGHVCFVCIV